MLVVEPACSDSGSSCSFSLQRLPQSEEKEMLEYHWLIRLLLWDLPVDVQVLQQPEFFPHQP